MDHFMHVYSDEKKKHCRFIYIYITHALCAVCTSICPITSVLMLDRKIIKTIYIYGTIYNRMLMIPSINIFSNILKLVLQRYAIL